MPWQQHVADVAMELRDDGMPAYRSVVVTVSRQQGKSALVRAVNLERMRRGRQWIAATAQTRQAARNRMLDQGRAMQAAELDAVVIRTGIGQERIEWNDSTLMIFSPTDDSGHGESIHLVSLDEVFSLSDGVLGGLIPAQAAILDAQRWAISTQGTDDSTVLNRWTEQGRERCEDPKTTTAFFEWSAPDDVDPLDPDNWALWMPALGITVHRSSIEADIGELSEREAIRAYGNRRVSSDRETMNLDPWLEASRVESPVGRRVVIAVDVNKGPAGGSIAAAWSIEGDDDSTRLHGEVVEFLPGRSLSWIVEAVEDLLRRHSVEVVALDGIGPAGSIEPDLRALAERYRATFRPIRSRDRGSADGFLFDGVVNGGVTLGPSEPLDRAIRSAVRQTDGDRWKFSRTQSLDDVSPLIALSHAVFAANEAQVSRVVPVIY